MIPFRMMKDDNEDGVNNVDDYASCILTMTTRCMDINIMAAMEAAELVLDRMSLANGGKGGLLVNTASLAGFSILGQLLPILLLLKELYLDGFKTCTATLRPSTRW